MAQTDSKIGRVPFSQLSIIDQLSVNTLMECYNVESDEYYEDIIEFYNRVLFTRV